MGKRRRQKKHVVPFDDVFRPDPHEDKEDTRPIEKRKKPNFSMRWS